MGFPFHACPPRTGNGLGPVAHRPAGRRRKRALEARQLRLSGVDPIDHRREQLQLARAEQAKVVTFDEAAERYIAGHEQGWRNAKHGAQWRSTLKTYALPYFGKLNVAEIDTALVAKSKSLSNMALLAVLRRIQRDDLTVHGFRSTFRDWAAEQTNYAREVAEQALAHAIGDKVEAAYRRSDLFEKRRRMMSEWAQFCASPIISTKFARLRGQRVA